MYKKGNKILASIIVFIMLMANMSTIGIHVGEVIATDSTLNTQNSKTNNSNVEFDSYFIDDENITHDVIKNIGEENKIVAQISVKNAGYLKNARIEFVESNFKILNQTSSDKISNIENNIISLNQIDNGEDIVLEIPFIFEHNTQIDLTEFDKISAVNFTGTYVDEDGKEREIEKEINLGLKWTANVETTVTGEITKYVPYDVNGQKGLIMQMLVKASVKDNVLPIKESNIEISVPQINGIKPSDVTVYSEMDFKKTYSEDDNKLTITTQNSVENNVIYWSDKEENSYIVTYTYAKEAISENEVDVDININSNIKLYSYNEQVVTPSFEQTVTLKDKIGEIVDFQISATEKLSKGYMYANYDREEEEEKLETIYTESVTAKISLPELVNEMTISMEADSFDKETNTNAISTYYKNIKIAKEQFNKFFGEDGFIKIYSGENLIQTIDNSIQEERIVLELNLDTLIIKTSNPIAEGELTIELEKAIKGELTYKKEQVESFESLKLTATAKATSDEIEIVNKEISSQIALIEPVLKAELSISDTDLSTVVPNENVEIRAILNTDSEYNKLYNNPTIVIDLPSYMENVNIKDVQLVFDEELGKEPSYELKENTDGTKQIIIQISGIQTKYSIGSSYGGANVVITADITANNLTPTTESQIKMTCINKEEQVEDIENIRFVAPVGVVTVNKISNFVESENIIALTSNEQATLEVATNSKTATAEIQVINNYSNVINNIQILGRTLAQGTTNTETGESLNNTFDAPMLGEINTNGLENVSVYYTENPSATQDLQNSENGWITEVTDFSKIKSYLIVLNGITMNVGDSVKFTYDAQIPENLEYSQNISSMYTVYFDNVQEEQTLQDKVTSRIVTLSTGVAPTLEVELSSYSEENSIVRDGQYVKFIATVKNTGTVNAENVRLNITAPSETTYYIYEEEGQERTITTDTTLVSDLEEDVATSYVTKHAEYVEEDFMSDYVTSDDVEKTINVGSIKAGENKKVEYELKIDEVEINSYFIADDSISDEEFTEEDMQEVTPKITLNNIVRVIADDMQKEVVSNEYKLEIDKAYMTVLLKADKSIDNILTKGNEVIYTVSVMQVDAHESLNNAVVRVEVPQGLIIKDANLESLSTLGEIESNINIDKDNNVVEFKVKEFYIGSQIVCNVITQVDDAIGIVSPKVTAVADGIGMHYTNNIRNTVSKLDFEIVQTNLDNPYVKEMEEITFEYIITNTSDVYCSDFIFESAIPDGMQVTTVQTLTGNETTILKDYSQEILTIVKTFKPGQTITFRITMKANLLEDGETQKEIINYATIYGENFETKISNAVEATIEYNPDAHKNLNPNPDNPNTPNVKKVISGIAWLDKNKDGQRNDDEDIISGMEVRLLNKVTNEVIQKTKTSSTGEYIFTEIDEGQYLVVFLYNSYKYDLTQYKKAEISQSTNSDVIDINMDIDGYETKVAISDIIVITDSNARNIDIGVCESEKSDLKLDKYISSITLTYGNTVKTYDYENAKLAKVEIPAKELSDATVIVEYKIVVTNEGAIGNYIKKIVDYIPKDMKFNSELNRDWYQSSNGDLYNSSLANTKLDSGESKEVTLTLTRKITEDNLGIVNNNAELYEVYNEEGILDIDSIVANKASDEDDISAADVVISVKTGDAIIYTIIISTLICTIIGVSIYFIRKKVLRKI